MQRFRNIYAIDSQSNISARQNLFRTCLFDVYIYMIYVYIFSIYISYQAGKNMHLLSERLASLGIMGAP